MEWGDILGGVAGAVTGGLISAPLAKYSADRAHGEAEWAMRESTALDNTKYQRQQADLKAAGLNPALAYMNGVGPSPQAHAAPVPDFGRVADTSMNSGFTALERGMSLKRLGSEIENIQSDTASKLADVIVKQEAAKTAPVAREGAAASAALDRLLAEISKLGDLPAAKMTGEIEGNKWYRWIKAAGQAIPNLFMGRPIMGVPRSRGGR